MKEFSCAELDNNCKAVLSAQTDDRLAELASSHPRQNHGMSSILQDMVARIEKLFTNKAIPDAAYIVDRIFEKYNCNSDPQCTWRYRAEAETILTGGNVHTRELKPA